MKEIYSGGYEIGSLARQTRLIFVLLTICQFISDYRRDHGNISPLLEGSACASKREV